MSRLYPYEGLLLNLQGAIPPAQRREFLPKERALARLRELTGKDFGYDAKAWAEWLKTNGLR